MLVANEGTKVVIQFEMQREKDKEQEKYSDVIESAIKQKKGKVEMSETGN